MSNSLERKLKRKKGQRSPASILEQNLKRAQRRSMSGAEAARTLGKRLDEQLIVQHQGSKIINLRNGLYDRDIVGRLGSGDDKISLFAQGKQQ